MIIFFIYGLIFGSFFNVLGLRIPHHIPFLKNRSVCPHCKTSLSWFELIPLVSFILQKGKCRTCHGKISLLYPIGEGLTGLLFMFSYIKIGLKLELLIALLLISLLMIISITDLTSLTIPNEILLFFLPLFLCLRAIAPTMPLSDAFFGAMVGLGMIALIILLSGGKMGGGDMKLFGVIGSALGMKLTVISFFLATTIGAIVAGGLLFVGKIKRETMIPFGPFIAVGTFISYFYGEELLLLYLTFIMK